MVEGKTGHTLHVCVEDRLADDRSWRIMRAASYAIGPHQVGYQQGRRQLILVSSCVGAAGSGLCIGNAYQLSGSLVCSEQVLPAQRTEQVCSVADVHAMQQQGSHGVLWQDQLKVQHPEISCAQQLCG